MAAYSLKENGVSAPCAPGSGRIELEDGMNRVLRGLGLRGWKAVWSPKDSSGRGEILPDDRLILIYEREPDRVWETFTHEVVELRLRAVLQPYRTLINALLDWADRQTYEAKERFIREFPDLLKLIEERAPNASRVGG